MVATSAVSYRCPINDAGEIALPFCVFANRLSQQNPIAEKLVLQSGNRIMLSAFPVIA